MTQRLIPALTELAPALIIFDKDGTLIHFEAMWATWITELAQRLEAELGRSIRERLFEVMGFDSETGRIAPHGHLSVTPMTRLRALTVGVLEQAGLTPGAAEASVAHVWQAPDPVSMAHPLTDLTTLFSTLRAYGLKIAVATSDDRAPTSATLAKLSLASFVAALACGDDGIPIKPAPEMVLMLCQTLEIPPAKTVVVGDNVDDLRMGRTAGVGLVIGVLSGVSSAEVLTPYADMLLPTVEGLIEDAR